jgi:prevent-host-death family protein
MHSRSIPEISEIATAPPCITGDTDQFMTDVSIRDLRNHGGEVIDRVLGGHDIVITRSGRPVAQILPISDRGTARSVLARWRPIPGLDFDQLRADLDSTIDPWL